MIVEVEERTLYDPLVNYLKSLGFEAIGEVSIRGRGRKKHSDILFKFNGVEFVVEVKLGLKSNDMPKAIAQAYDYANRLGTKNIIILNYPEDVRQTIFSFGTVDDLALNKEVQALVLTEFWTKSLTCTPKDLFGQIKTMLSLKKQEIDFKTVVKLIEDYVIELNEVIKKINTDNLVKEVVNKLDLFAAIGDIRDKETAKKQIVNLASYLLFNQLLFYHIYTKKVKDCKLPELGEVEKIKDLQEYFDLITNIDYKSIYEINLLGHIEDTPEVIEVLNRIIKAIKLLRAEYITHDLAGRFFHDLIPHEVRKVLAAFYTHPIAAEILAGLTIDDWDESVIDPSCGSGTLLVSAYRRKMDIYTKLYGYQNLGEIHKKFIENDITGIDIMPFAAHLSAINLTMQNIEYPTNTVRIATQDALDLAKQLKTDSFKKEGIEISAYTEFIQKTLTELVLDKKKKGALSPEGRGGGFHLKPVDVVIMNPPYSDREKMPLEMRDKLKKNKLLGNICGHQVNLWGYFIALAHYLLKDGGKIGAVIPINIARGKATEKIRNFLLENYHIRYIVKPVGDLAFSEGAAFRDVLLIAEKRKPKEDDVTKIVFVKKSIRDMGEMDVERILRFDKEFVDVREVKYSELINYKDNFMPLLMPEELFSLSKILTKSNKLMYFDTSQIDIGLPYRPKGVADGVFITRPLDESRIRKTKVIILEEKQNYVVVGIKNIPKNQFSYKFEKDYLKPALRTNTGIRKLAISKKEVDYILVKKDEKYWELLRNYGIEIPNPFPWELHDKNNIIKEGSYLIIPDKINLVSPNTCFISIFSENPLSCVGSTLWYIKNFSKEDAKIINLYFNSIVSLLQFILLKSETLGAYSRLLKNDWQQFKILNIKKLTNQEKQTLLNLFEKLKNVEFPSILEQLENRFWARVELDKTILQIIGFSKREINEWLPKVYDALVEELKAMKNCY